MSNAELFVSTNPEPKSIAIIGGGVASVCLADHIFQLAPQTQVSIFCADSELANRGSGNKQGAIYPLLQGSQSVIAEFYATCYDYAMTYYQQKVAAGLQFEHGFTGLLQQAIKPELEDRLLKVAQTWPKQCRFLNADESSQVAGIELPYPSIFFDKAGWVWPQQFCQQLAQHLEQEFALSIKLNSKIVELEQQTQWQLLTETGPLDEGFDAVIICTGHKANQYQQSAHIPLQSVRGQVSRLRGDTELSALKTVLCHKGYITPSQGKYQCFGATFVKDDNSEQVREDEQAANLKQLKTVYSEQTWSAAVTADDVVADKAAIRAMSPDHIPIIGEVFSDKWIRQNVDKNTGRLTRLGSPQLTHPNSDLSGCYIFTGLGARGLTSAPLLAKQMVSTMFNQASCFNERMRKATDAKRFQVRRLKQLKTEF